MKRKSAIFQNATGLFQFFKELFCAFDLWTDFSILYWLVFNHPAWALVTIITMMAPFFVIYIPFIHFLAKGERAQSY
jgi:hypothetical protein